MSGDKKTQGKYLAIVIAPEDAIMSILKRVGFNIHMNQISDEEYKKRIIKKLCIDPNVVLAICIRVDKQRIVNKIKNMRAVKHSNITNDMIYVQFNRLIMSYIKKKISVFLPKYRHALPDIVFQCDGDSIYFLKDNGLRHAHKGYWYNVCDIIAYANHSKPEPYGIIPIDLTKYLEEKLREHFRK